MRSVALGLWVRTGSRDETPAQAGVSHFLEHLLFKGTKRHSAIEIAEIFDGMGASINAATGKESTHLHARFLDTHTDRAFDLLAEMLLAPTYPEIDSEREVVLEEIAMYEDEPQDRVHDVLDEAIFGEHPLGRRVLGAAEVISSIPVPDIDAYHQARYTAANIVVAAAGNVDHEAIAELARTHVEPRIGKADREARRLRPRDPGPRRLPLQGDRAVPRHPGRPGLGARRRSPLRAGDPRHGLRRLDLVAAVPRGPREEGPGLRGRLLHAAVRRRRPDRALRRHPRGQHRGGLRDHRPRARARSTPTGSPTTSWPAPRSTSRAAWSSPRSPPPRACRGSASRSCSTPSC